jgi:glycosyltransferase involved in cell wall biosynthesis
LLQVERGLLEVLHVMKKHPDWKMDLAGFGGDEAALRTQAEELDNVLWHGRISYTRALELSSQADVLFATYDPAIPNHRYASPNKVFEAMMLGIPIIGARGTNVDKIIEKYNCGLVIEYGIIDQLDKALTTLYEAPELRSWFGSNGREAYKSEFNWAEMESRLLDLYAFIQSFNINA